MKIIPFYLPQYHTIPLNDEIWGNGFTEWTNVKKADPLFKGHNQPRVPLNKNYYNLLDKNSIIWQINLAKQNNIYGFCLYHYWFNGDLLLEKPVEIFRDNKDLDINFCICWANESWTKAWADKSVTVIKQQKYGTKEDWIKHFNYLLDFFKDERYIKFNNKPVFIIYKPELIDCFIEMENLFSKMAKDNGFDGICFIYQNYTGNSASEEIKNKFDYRITYEPQYSMIENRNRIKQFFIKQFHAINKLLNKFNIQINRPEGIVHYDYKELIDISINRKYSNKCIPCIFTDWDNTPRRKNKGSVVDNGGNPELFDYYLNSINKKVLNKEFSTEYVFAFAWNEWGEGGYLEPDEKNQCKLLEICKKYGEL